MASTFPSPTDFISEVMRRRSITAADLARVIILPEGYYHEHPEIFRLMHAISEDLPPDVQDRVRQHLNDAIKIVQDHQRSHF